MKESYAFDEIGEALAHYIKETSGVKISAIGTEVLGIHPTNASRRLQSNNLRIKEVAAIAEYLGLDIQVNIGPIKTEKNTSVDVMSHINNQQKLIEAMERIRELEAKLGEGI